MSTLPFVKHGQPDLPHDLRFYLKGSKVTTATVFQHLKKFGQLLDTEISASTKIPLKQVRTAIAELSEQGEISQCSVTKYEDGKPIQGIQCRISGYCPPAAPGRKPSK